MKQRIFQFIALVALVATVSPTISRASNKEIEPKVKGSLSARGISKANFPRTAKITASDATRIATLANGGSVLSVGLENEDGFLVYAVEVAGTNSGRHEILVDAGNGKVLADMRHSGKSKADAENEDGERGDD
jgi:uncharacterized membrane protein YkoI